MIARINGQLNRGNVHEMIDAAKRALVVETPLLLTTFATSLA